MWKLFNKLFGWEYIRWSINLRSGIARLRTFSDGGKYYRVGNYIVELPAPRFINIEYLNEH